MKSKTVLHIAIYRFGYNFGSINNHRDNSTKDFSCDSNSLFHVNVYLYNYKEEDDNNVDGLVCANFKDLGVERATILIKNK